MLSSRRESRVRAQRGSVLSALLIIVAFLSILGGAMMSEISGQFLLGSTLSGRIMTEATMNSSVEYGLGQLKTRTVPSRCSTDTGSRFPVNLNGQFAGAVSNCQAIIPDQVARLVNGTFSADGTHVTIGGNDSYLIGDSGGRVFNFGFGQTAPLWSVSVGAGVTGPPSEQVDSARTSHLMTLVPNGSSVALIDTGSGSGTLRCSMPATGTVSARPGFENPPAGTAALFPEYGYFGDASGRLYVYDAQTDGSCSQQATVSGIGGPVVGGPLVLSGTVTTQRGGEGRDQRTTTATTQVFALVNTGGSSRLLQYSYQEETQGPGDVQPILVPVDSLSLPFANAAGFALNTTTPVDRQSLELAITFVGGEVALASINAHKGGSGWTYTMTNGPKVALGGSFTRAPDWCHCPGGDKIGAGNQNGTLFILDASLNQLLRYPGASPISTTPAADSNGDWYFGANDGFVYDVEPPSAGVLMFMAARFGPGGQVRSSPVVGSSSGCSGVVCLYFGAGGNGDYFAQIGKIRVMDMTACLAPSSSSTSCTGNQLLWTRAEVGDPKYVGASGVNVVGWSYYNVP